MAYDTYQYGGPWAIPIELRNDPEQGHYPNEVQAYAYQGDTSTHASHQKFLSYFGMLSNSYYAKPLLFCTFFVTFLNVTVLATIFIIIPRNDTFNDFQNSSCSDLMSDLIWIEFVGLVNVILAFPASSIARFRLHLEDGSRSLTLFHKTCLVFIILESVFLCAMAVVAAYATIKEINSSTGCFSSFKSEWEYSFIWALVATGILYFGIWYQIAIFDKFRSHYSGQIGLGSRGNQLNRPKLHPLRRECLSIFSKRHEHALRLQQKLFQSAFKGDVEQLSKTLQECKRTYGIHFAKEFYGEASLWFNRFAISTHNPLHAACARGQVAVVEKLLEYGFEINNYDKLIPFMWSVQNIYRLLMDSLPWITYINHVETSSDVYGVLSSLSQTLLTPLHCAVANDSIEVVTLLIQRGADLDKFARSSSQNVRVPPIFMVQSSEIADELIRAGANHLIVPSASFVRTIYEVAFQQSKLALCRSLEYWGGDFALTPLHAASASNDAKRVVSLLDWGAIPDSLGENVTGYFQRSPLHWAAIANSVEAAKELIQHGATVNIRDMHGMTPLHWAARHHHQEVIGLLLKSKADPLLRDKKDRTALAIVAGHEGASQMMIKDIVSAGADINARIGKLQDTPMHIALKQGHKETAISLLRNGADILITNSEGKRPLDCTLSTDIQFAVKREAGTRDVMISYTHTHTEFATKIRESLERNKITVWMDSMSPSGIGGGAVWREEVARGIMNAAVVLCILTENYQQSKWCMKELALAKQVGTPIVAISPETVHMTEELQVYLYTRQIIPFQRVIKSVDRVNPKAITYKYSRKQYETQVGLLLDGLRDEIEKNRLLNERVRKMTIQRRSGGGYSLPALVAEIGRLSQEDTMVFIAHGDYHADFAARLQLAIESAGFSCYVDSTPLEMGERIRRAKDAILRCTAFIPILSDSSIKSDILADQLAFAEDKEKVIVPILYTEPDFDPAKKYQLSRNRFFHFSGDIGFKDSFDLFEDHLASQILDLDNIPIMDEIIDFDNENRPPVRTRSRGYTYLETISNSTARTRSTSLSSATSSTALSLM